MDLLCECWSHNSVHTLMRSPCSVKLSALWFNFILLTSQQVSLSVSHRCWKKTRDSWVREKELYYSQHSTKRMSIRMSASIPLVSKFHTGEWRGPERCHMCSGFVLQLGNSKLGEPTAFPARGKLARSLSKADTLPHLTGYQLHKHTWKMAWVTGPCSLSKPSKTYRNSRSPSKTVFLNRSKKSNDQYGWQHHWHLEIRSKRTLMT